ncbi:hypothetical protein N7468_005659 [Penicillium chermesinum]|uniref:Uncharacterized protein n=1 Tax=Penicillium chermesinum TaxID=63820 RepID=A0A9W9TNL7_9EURO|nr:uncharacterized protein N7468_005659 [Penicillium chermesinum]KAJ5232703.1 hypothetical protein N7468_005659 [Penicillium chermesinum]KAJ6172361.1 hypothetical protein N7470_001428 [Penicillium chermesinum]
MELVHGNQLSYEDVGLTHRGSGIAFKHLFLGPENTPGNYLLSISRQQVFHSPIHRHNFDQFRFAYRGDVSISPDVILREGELCYHPEGVYYGPQNDTEGERNVLILQFGGTSGQGYLSFAQMKEGHDDLKKHGHFEGGKFYSAAGGEPVDGYEAIWRHTSGRSLSYPEPRYHSIIVSKPKNYQWVRSEGINADVKTMGVFTERETRADLIRVKANAPAKLAGQDAVQLLFVLTGKGKANEDAVETESAIRLLPSIGVELSSDSELILVRFVLPTLH